MGQEVLDSNTQRTKGQDAFTQNIYAITALSEIIKTTLGPFGMDKMLIDSIGDSIITNDGVQILKSIDIAHPAAQLVVEIAKTQDKNIGDGTTSAVILIAEFLEEFLQLYHLNIHQNSIVKTFTQACDYVLSKLEELSIDISSDIETYVSDIIKTAMRGKSSEAYSEYLAQLLSTVIVKSYNSTQNFSKHNVKCLKVIGPSIEDSVIVQGVVFDKKKLHPQMPDEILNPNILVCSCPIEVQEIENSHQIQLNSYKDYEEFISQEKKYLFEVAQKIQELKVNVVVCQKGVDDSVVSYLAQNGILVLRRCKKSDIEILSKATNTTLLHNLDELNETYVTQISNVKVLTISNEELISFEVENNSNSSNNKENISSQLSTNSQFFSIIVTATTYHILDEIERAIEDSIGDISNVLSTKRIVAGGGAIECQIYALLVEYAKNKVGKEQLIVESFAKSFLSIPKVLAKNCGLDELEILSQLKHNHSYSNSNIQSQKKYSGINSSSGVCDDMIAIGVIEPLGVIEQIILSSKEAVSMILRIDDIIAAKKINSSSNEFNEEL